MTVAGSLFCNICALTPDDGTPCRICKRTSAPERGGGDAAFNAWLKKRDLTIPEPRKSE